MNCFLLSTLSRRAVIIRAGAVILCAVVCPTTVRALGVRIPNQDAEAIARGNAFAATANNPSALYYNPAGITQIEGHEAQFGLLSYLGVNSEYTSFTGNRAKTKYRIEPVPQLHYVFSPKDNPFSFGLGVFAPFGLGLEWPEDTGFRTLALEARLNYVTVAPVVAMQVHRTLSLAIGPTINYSDLDLRRGLFNPTPNSDEFRFKGDDFDYGFTAGLLWQPHEKWSFGAKYRSPTSINYRGKSEYTGLPESDHASARFDYPQNVVVGVSFRPTRKWNIEANVDWTDWDTLNTVNLKNTPLGPSAAFILNWESSFFYELGVSRYFDNGYFVSAGYFFSENSTSEKHFNPLVPDTDLHVGSVGVGFKGIHWRWALSSQLITTGPSRAVRDSQPSPAGQSADGKYRFFIPTVAVSVGYHF